MSSSIEESEVEVSVRTSAQHSGTRTTARCQSDTDANRTARAVKHQAGANAPGSPDKTGTLSSTLEGLVAGPQLANVLAEQWKRFRKRLRQCQRHFSEDAVHDTRVHTRRLIARLVLLKGVMPGADVEDALRSLKRCLKALSELRDVQVQRLFVTNRLSGYPELAGIWIQLCRREERLIKRAARKVERFQLKKVSRWVRKIRKQLQQPQGAPGEQPDIARTLREATEEAFQEVVRLRRSVNSREPGTIHQVRLAYKKFRYMVESMPPELPQPSAQQLDAMAGYQRAMGLIQDVDVLLGFIARFEEEHPHARGNLKRFRASLLRRRRRLIRQYLEIADSLYAFWPLEASGTANPATDTPERPGNIVLAI